MEVVFRFEKDKAQILLEPQNAFDRANLDTVMALGAGLIHVKPNAEKALMVELMRTDPIEHEPINNPNDFGLEPPLNGRKKS